MSKVRIPIRLKYSLYRNDPGVDYLNFEADESEIQKFCNSSLQIRSEKKEALEKYIQSIIYAERSNGNNNFMIHSLDINSSSFFRG